MTTNSRGPIHAPTVLAFGAAAFVIINIATVWLVVVFG